MVGRKVGASKMRHRCMVELYAFLWLLGLGDRGLIRVAVLCRIMYVMSFASNVVVVGNREGVLTM